MLSFVSWTAGWWCRCDPWDVLALTVWAMFCNGSRQM